MPAFFSSKTPYRIQWKSVFMITGFVVLMPGFICEGLGKARDDHLSDISSR